MLKVSIGEAGRRIYESGEGDLLGQGSSGRRGEEVTNGSVASRPVVSGRKGLTV